MIDDFAALQACSSPFYGHLSADLHVEFAVRPFRHARVAWLNERWFSDAGIDVSLEQVRSGITDWIIHHFGVGVPSVDDPPDQYSDEERSLHADRYGAPSGSAHGGSGRVGVFGAFNAKGIGRTPLVSVTSDWYHSHGCMFLEEAVREAILSEVAHRTFPVGAVPTIAVIDVGARLRWGDGTYGARRAVIVRPAFLRIANLMRSIYFGTSGFAGADQVADAACVRDIWRETKPAAWLDGTFRAIGRQYGYGNALRLWPGPLFASNVTLDGRLVDFGSFRSLPNWRRAQGEAREHGFGNETAMAEAAARSLQRNGERQGVSVSTHLLVEAFREGFSRGFEDALRAHDVAPGTDFAILLKTTRDQQSRILTDLTGGPDDGVTIGGLLPWRTLMRERLVDRTEAMIAGLDETPAPDLEPIARFIEHEIAAADPRTSATRFQKHPDLDE